MQQPKIDITRLIIFYFNIYNKRDYRRNLFLVVQNKNNEKNLDYPSVPICRNGGSLLASNAISTHLDSHTWAKRFDRRAGIRLFKHDEPAIHG